MIILLASNDFASATSAAGFHSVSVRAHTPWHGHRQVDLAT